MYPFAGEAKFLVPKEQPPRKLSGKVDRERNVKRWKVPGYWHTEGVSLFG
ncbi:hypothetical protein MNBD_ALPHA06-2252 [hydrothermal vent metagenome]|uniref:Uncharacterized protein n=1 Tax=hydrothermal vent metagenome TaxID=652676 RepID=A0A3B0RRL8_9ZZZZ